MNNINPPILIVGAGIAGLQCATALQAAGQEVLILDKSRGVGGRGATRRIKNTCVDHGAGFLHGTDPEFLKDIQQHIEEEARIEGWPLRVVGKGTPCQPAAFQPNSWRVALRHGVNEYAKALADGLPIERSITVESIQQIKDAEGRYQHYLVQTNAQTFEAATVILTPPVPQSLALLSEFPGEDIESKALHHLLQQVAYPRCLTIMVSFSRSELSVDWDALYPDSKIVQVIFNESSKRSDEETTILLVQAQPAWSKAHWDQPWEAWESALLKATATLLNIELPKPLWKDSHRWKFARSAEGGHFHGPMLYRRDATRLGFAGDAFDWSGGLQAAWQSGRTLAARILGEGRKASISGGE